MIAVIWCSEKRGDCWAAPSAVTVRRGRLSCASGMGPVRVVDVCGPPRGRPHHQDGSGGGDIFFSYVASTLKNTMLIAMVTFTFALVAIPRKTLRIFLSNLVIFRSFLWVVMTGQVHPKRNGSASAGSKRSGEGRGPCRAATLG